jgi:hypothetical protein
VCVCVCGGGGVEDGGAWGRMWAWVGGVHGLLVHW